MVSDYPYFMEKSLIGELTWYAMNKPEVYFLVAIATDWMYYKVSGYWSTNKGSNGTLLEKEYKVKEIWSQEENLRNNAKSAFLVWREWKLGFPKSIFPNQN